MGWKSYIPLAGNKTVRKKLKEIEDNAATLPVIFGMFFTKVFETIITGEFVLAIRFFGGAIIVAVVYIYKHEMKQKAQEAKETAEEKIEEANDS